MQVMDRLMSRGRAWTLGAVGAALVVAAWMGVFTDDEGEPSAVAPAFTSASPWSAPAPSPALLDRPTAAVPAKTTAGSVRHVPVSITVTAPQQVHVGEQTELVVAVAANPDVAEIGFTVRFDPDVLQGRAGTPGDWRAPGGGANVAFAADVTESGDRVQIRSVASARPARAEGGSVAVVQFQAVSAGTTVVTITDVTLKDAAAHTMPARVWSPKLHVVVDAPPAASAPAG
jgi:hypothetical protein